VLRAFDGWPEPYIYTPYTTVYLGISLPTHTVGTPYTCMWFWPTLGIREYIVNESKIAANAVAASPLLVILRSCVF